MQSMSFSYKKTSLVSSDDLVRASQNLKPEIERIKEAIAGGGYHTPYASVNLLADEQLMQSVLALAQEKKALRPTALVVIGIGGSNLGTQAVHQALYGTFYNEQEPEIKVYFADTVDTDYIYDIILLIEQELEKDHNIILNVISKSGSTTETIANFELFLHLLKQAKKVDYQKYIVVTTDEGSRLWNFAQQEGCACLAIPEQVGGRYSVFSAVGLFPLALLGVDIAALRDGARSMLSGCTYDDIFNNPAALSAAILNHFLKQ